MIRGILSRAKQAFFLEVNEPFRQISRPKLLDLNTNYKSLFQKICLSFKELKELNGTSVILVPTDQMISLPNAIMALWIYCNNCLLELIGLAQK